MRSASRGPRHAGTRRGFRAEPCRLRRSRHRVVETARPPSRRSNLRRCAPAPGLGHRGRRAGEPLPYRSGQWRRSRGSKAWIYSRTVMHLRDSSPPDEPAVVTLERIRAAAEVIRGVVVRTPLLPFGRTRACLKPESLQPIRPFKLRGAYYNIATLPAERRASGVVAFSSAKHAHGVRRADRLLGVRAVIVMPSNAPRIKVERVRADGAEIVFVGPSSEERAQRAAELARVEGFSLVAPYDDAATITGQGTVGLEIVEQLAEIDRGSPAWDSAAQPNGRGAEPAPFTVLVPVGGGGIASGVAVAVKSLRADPVVVGVEPALAADARDSLADGQRTTHIGRIPFALLRRYLDGIVTVTEDEIARAMVRASREARLMLEPSGATTLAAWLFHEDELPASGRVVSILSGGNVDPVRYDELLARGVAAGG